MRNKLTNTYLVIIPARGGSKSIKNKNLQLFDGISLIGNAINKFKGLEYKFDIIVSSDSELILNEAKKFGAISILRPNSISNDNATSESAINHAIGEYEKLNREFNSIIFHQCTSPLISKKTIVKIIKEFEMSPSNTIFTVSEEYNPFWLYNEKSNKYNISSSINKIRGPRQKRKPNMIETGGIYIFDKKQFELSGNRFNGEPIPFVLNKIESLDIDEPTDLEIAKSLLKLTKK